MLGYTLCPRQLVPVSWPAGLWGNYNLSGSVSMLGCIQGRGVL